MNDNEKQAIEEMARILCAACASDPSPCYLVGEGKMCEGVLKSAEVSYNAGYRKQEWISVKEQLPELNTMVLVFTMRGSFEVARYNIYHNGTLPLWMTNEDIWKYEIITHWMPLPEPPKMKGGAE